MYKHRFFFISILCFSIVSCVLGYGKDKFTEELFVKPLFNNHVYTYFQFTTTSTSNDLFKHCYLFPRSLGEILSQYQVEELHLSLTEGLWRHVNWGYPIVDAPPGAEMYAWFQDTSPDIDFQWKQLAVTLSGLFCSSLNFIDSSNTLIPEMSFRPSGVWKSQRANSSLLRYAILPREIVCTENLTPWKKLLPCDSRKGLASLLNSARLHNTNYHSLGIHFRSVCGDEKCKTKTYELKQTMSLVYDPEIVGSRDWSIQKLFGQGLSGACPLSDSSLVYVDVSTNISKPFVLTPPPHSQEVFERGGTKVNISVYDLNKTKSMFNIAAIHSTPHKPSVHIPPPLHATRYIAGYGQERGALVTYLYNNHWQPLDVIFMENIPWFLPVYLNTLKVVANGQLHNPRSLHYIPGKGKNRPYYLEFTISLPPKSTTKISIDFDYVFMKWQEYPPDANHGFYIGSGVITSLLPMAKNYTTSVHYYGSILSTLNDSRSGYFVQIHTETMMITLPTPDFSMPYNVICLACTVVALAFGPLHNITTKSLQLKLDSDESNGGLLQKIKSKFRKGRAPKTEDVTK